MKTIHHDSAPLRVQFSSTIANKTSLSSANTNTIPSSLRKFCHDIHRIRQRPVQMERHAQALALAQTDLDRLQGHPVVWRWVPSTVSPHRSEPASLLASPSNPRVIYATANRVDSNSSSNKNSNESEGSQLVLTGGELREAREVLIRSKTKLLAKAPLKKRALLMPNVPEKSNWDDSNKSGAGSDLEAANLLLQMGGTPLNTKISDSKEKDTRSTKKAPSPEVPSPPVSKNSLSKSSKSSPLEDEYLKNWVGGSVSLHTPEDDDVLSPLHCFMRRYCVEAFSATAEDVATPRYGKSHGFKVEIGQVGIRCLHCKSCAPRDRAERAVCYPSSLRNIYHSIETWQRRHSLVCKHITPWVRKSIMDLMVSSKTRAGGRRQYWEDSARRLGMVDTSRGVRFSRKPGDLGPIPSPLACRMPGVPDAPGHKPEPVVRVDDQDLVTDYLFLLMKQMQTCRFTESDRVGGRSKIKDNEVGFPGMECRHCQGRAGFGRYFPSSVAALSLANSDRNVYNHLLKCRKCPESIKKELVSLQKKQSQSKNRRGLRKLFFNRIWSRIHKEGKEPEDKKKVKAKKPSPPPAPAPVSPTAAPLAVSSPAVAVAMQQRHTPNQFVPYRVVQEAIPKMATSMISHPYHGSMHPHPQVVVNNFRSY